MYNKYPILNKSGKCKSFIKFTLNERAVMCIKVFLRTTNVFASNLRSAN